MGCRCSVAVILMRGIVSNTCTHAHNNFPTHMTPLSLLTKMKRQCFEQFDNLIAGKTSFLACPKLPKASDVMVVQFFGLVFVDLCFNIYSRHKVNQILLPYYVFVCVTNTLYVIYVHVYIYICIYIYTHIYM